MLGFTDLPWPLRVYLVVVAVLGPAVALGLAREGRVWENSTQFWISVLLVMLAALADRYQLTFSHQTTINAATVAHVAMIITLPLGAPGLLVLIAIAAGHVGRRAEVPELLFNVGQGALYASAGALTYHLLHTRLPHDPAWANDAATLVALVAAAAVLHLANTGLVAVAVGLQLRVDPFRVWSRSLSVDLLPHVAMTAVGVVAAVVALNEPMVLPLLLLPIFLIRHAVRQLIQLQQDTVAALASLVDIIELRDPYTAGHSRRVAALARDLALRLGMTAEEADNLESAGRIHDIGKVAVDPEVLRKPGKLDDCEWEQMRMHPVYGAEVIARFNAYGQGHLLVRHHHESYDGGGYPDGIAGEAIPLGARILAVADTFDALTSDRPYRKGMGVERALEILQEGAGKQWDAKVVAALVGHLREGNVVATPERVRGVVLV